MIKVFQFNFIYIVPVTIEIVSGRFIELISLTNLISNSFEVNYLATSAKLLTELCIDSGSGGRGVVQQ